MNPTNYQSYIVSNNNVTSMISSRRKKSKELIAFKNIFFSSLWDHFQGKPISNEIDNTKNTKSRNKKFTLM